MSKRTGSTSDSFAMRVLAVSVGLVLLIPAGYKLLTYCSFRFLGNHTEGIVIHSSSGRDMGGRPFLQYEDGGGSLHEFKSRAKTHWFKRPVLGEKIEVFIDKNDPGTAIVNNLFYYVYLPLLLIVVGGWCFLLGIWFHRERDRDG